MYKKAYKLFILCKIMPIESELRIYEDNGRFVLEEPGRLFCTHDLELALLYLFTSHKDLLDKKPIYKFVEPYLVNVFETVRVTASHFYNPEIDSRISIIDCL